MAIATRSDKKKEAAAGSSTTPAPSASYAAVTTPQQSEEKSAKPDAKPDARAINTGPDSTDIVSTVTKLMEAQTAHIAGLIQQHAERLENLELAAQTAASTVESLEASTVELHNRFSSLCEDNKHQGLMRDNGVFERDSDDNMDRDDNKEHENRNDDSICTSDVNRQADMNDDIHDVHHYKNTHSAPGKLGQAWKNREARERENNNNRSNEQHNPRDRTTRGPKNNKHAKKKNVKKKKAHHRQQAHGGGHGDSSDGSSSSSEDDHKDGRVPLSSDSSDADEDTPPRSGPRGTPDFPWRSSPSYRRNVDATLGKGFSTMDRVKQPRIEFTGKKTEVPAHFNAWCQAIDAWLTHNPNLSPLDYLPRIAMDNLKKHAKQAYDSERQAAADQHRECFVRDFPSLVDFLKRRFPDPRTLDDSDKRLRNLDPNDKRFLDDASGYPDIYAFLVHFDTLCTEGRRRPHEQIIELMDILEWFCPPAYRELKQHRSWVRLNRPVDGLARGDNIGASEYESFRRAALEYFAPHTIASRELYTREIRVSTRTRDSPVTTKQRSQRAHYSNSPKSGSTSRRNALPAPATHLDDDRAETCIPVSNGIHVLYKHYLNYTQGQPRAGKPASMITNRSCPICGGDDWRKCGGWFNCTNVADLKSRQEELRNDPTISDADKKLIKRFDRTLRSLVVTANMSSDEKNNAVSEAIYLLHREHARRSRTTDSSSDSESSSDDDLN